MINTLFSTALAFFLIANPIGNMPAFMAQVKHFDFGRQKKILIREAFIALFIALFFQFLGEFFLGLLMVQDFALRICGGCLLFITSLRMIFPSLEEKEKQKVLQEPMVVPIATPLITGPGLMTTIMIYSREEKNDLLITGAIFITWMGILTILTLAPYLKKILGESGMTALEQLMGMVLSLIAMQMFMSGVDLFIKSCN